MPSMTYLFVALSVVSLVFGAVVSPQGQAQISFGSNGANCLAAPTNANGAVVSIQPCSTASSLPSSQLWTVSAGTSASGTLKIYSDKCLDVTNGVNTDGTKLQIWTCAAGNTNQVFNVTNNNNGAISWSGTNKCVDLTDGKITAGNQVQVWTCTGGPNQKWTPKPIASTPQNPPPGKAATFTIVESDPNFVAPCIYATNFSNGAPVIIQECRGQAGIFWTLPNGGAASNTAQGPITSFTVDNQQYCLDLPSGNTADGTKLQVWSCTGGPNQRWRYNGDGTITFAGVNNSGVNKCVDLTDGKQTTGDNTQLQLWTCTPNNSNQHWKSTAAA